MTMACVIGWPISHSRSPLIHNYWISQYGFDAIYEKVPVRPEQLEEFFRTFQDQGYIGCNVTLPHKENAFHILNAADEPTRRLRAVNTVYVSNGKLLGTNTDGEGFLNSLKAALPTLGFTDIRAVVIGAGGAAASIADALLTSGTSEIALVNRSRDRAEQLRNRLGNRIVVLPWEQRADALTDCQLLVNTTSLGMTGQPALQISLDRLPTTAAVADIVYSPLRTDLLEQARARGNPTIEGLGMLLHQAVRGFELWFGIRPVVTRELHDLIAKDIDGELRR